MKKYFVIALAATAMLSLNSCSNEEELMSAEGLVLSALTSPTMTLWLHVTYNLSQTFLRGMQK